METSLALGIDQGSSSTKGLLISARGEIIESYRIPVSYTCAGPEIYEQDATEILATVSEIIHCAERAVRARKTGIESIGFSCQRSGAVAWEQSSGEPVAPIINWRDTRTLPLIEALSAEHATIFKETGIPPSPLYAGGKIALLQERFPDQGILTGTLDSFLHWSLSDSQRSATAFSSDDTMAHRTMLYSLVDQNWCEKLCALFNVKKERLPHIYPSFSHHGSYSGIPVRLRIGDQQAALLGGLIAARRTVLNLGTIGSLVHLTGDQQLALPGYISSLLYSNKAPLQPELKQMQHIIEATVNCCGETVAIITEKLGINVEEISKVCAAAASNRDVLVGYCPFGGLTTPDWINAVSNCMPGWKEACADSICLALTESLGSFICRNILDFKDEGLINPEADIIRVTGGVASLDYLLQYIADVSGFTLERIAGQESGARMAALGSLGGHSALKHTESELASIEAVFHPAARSRSSAGIRYQSWEILGERARAGQLADDEIFTP